MSPHNTRSSKKNKTVGVKPNLVRNIQDVTVSKKKQRIETPNQPPPEVPVPDNETEEMDIELESNETTPNDSSSSTVPLPSPTAATKGKDLENNQTLEFHPTAATLLVPPEETNNPPPIDDSLYEKITRRTPHKAATLFFNIKGNNKHAKFIEVCRQFGHIPGYAGKTTHTIKRNTYMVVYFDSNDELLQVITDKNYPLEGNDDLEYHYLPYEEIHQQPTAEDIRKEKQRTIQVLDLPLEVRTPLLRAIFSKYDEIEKIELITRGIYQQAFIRYKKLDTVDSFKNIWSVLVKRHGVRVISLNAENTA